jgi:hypothetical protein
MVIETGDLSEHAVALTLTIFLIALKMQALPHLQQFQQGSIAAAKVGLPSFASAYNGTMPPYKVQGICVLQLFAVISRTPFIHPEAQGVVLSQVMYLSSSSPPELCIFS